jgi:hypothetical protein
MSVLKDSGYRQEFPSGAVRDTAEGKGRMDLIDIDCAAHLLKDDPIMFRISEFVQLKDLDALYDAMQLFAETHYGNIYTAMIEVSHQFEDGAKKYEPHNWRRGIPLHCYIDSALRHYMKHLRGDTDEPHDRAFMWNLMCARWTIVNRPDLDDIDDSYVDGPHL